MKHRSSTQRCCICDYKEGEGSEYADVADSGAIRVLYDSDREDYYCTNCLNSINATIYSYVDK